MKVGIVTYHTAHNYGAMLQAYALQKAIQDLGHNPLFVHYQSDFSIRPKYERKKGKGLKSIPRRMAIFFTKPWLKRRHVRFVKFMNSQFLMSQRYPTEALLSNTPPDVDAYVCGSDQIWNLESGASPVYFMGFTPDNKRLISYAPSFGRHIVPDEYRENVVKWLKRFDAISVREQDGCELVNRLTGRTAKHVLDPVFLVDNAEWKYLSKSPSINRPYMAFYSLESSRRTSEIVNCLAKHAKLPVIVLGKAGSFILKNRFKIAIDAGPAEFLGWILNARLVVTNSFHATAFSAKFGIPFVTIAHSTRNSRMSDLLGRFGITDRIIHHSSEITDPDKFLRKPNCQNMEALTKDSLEFLRVALKR